MDVTCRSSLVLLLVTLSFPSSSCDMLPNGLEPNSMGNTAPKSVAQFLDRQTQRPPSGRLGFPRSDPLRAPKDDIPTTPHTWRSELQAQNGQRGWSMEYTVLHTATAKLSGCYAPVMQLLLLAVVGVQAWFRLAPSSSSSPSHVTFWSMASSGASEGLYEDQRQQRASEKSKLTDAAGKTLKGMYEGLAEQDPLASPVLAQVTAKSTLQSLDVVLGVDDTLPAAASETNPYAQQTTPPPQETIQDTPDTTAASSSTDGPQTVFSVPINSVDQWWIVPSADVLTMKKKVFSGSGFQVTRTERPRRFNRTSIVMGGHIFRGELQGALSETIQCVQQRTRQVFGDRYEVLIIPDVPQFDEMMMEMPPPNTNRPAFLLLPSQALASPAITLPQKSLSALSLVATLGATYLTSLAIGLVGLAPADLKAVLESSSLETLLQVVVSHLDVISMVALPVFASVVASNVAHEVGRRIAARKHLVDVSLPYFLPSMNIGTLGVVTRLRSMVPNHAALFDIGAAGPLAGGGVAFLCLLAGVVLSQSAPLDDSSLVSIPNKVFQSSYFLGWLLTGLLGSDGGIHCHPLVIGGWLGLLCSALSTLPIGTTNGGRMMQAIVGQSRKDVASLLTLLCLAFSGLAPGGLGISWGIACILFQDKSEYKLKDHFTPVDSMRRNMGILMIMSSVLLLVPSP